MLGIKNDKDLGERLVDVCGVLFCLGVLCLVARGLLPLLGDDTPADLKYQESAREKGLTPLFGDYAAPGLERRESVLAGPLRLAYTVGLVGGAAGILLGFCLWRPRRLRLLAHRASPGLTPGAVHARTAVARLRRAVGRAPGPLAPSARTPSRAGRRGSENRSGRG